MQIIVVSNSPSKRIEYFVEAGRSLQTGVRFMTYEELFNCLPSLRQAVVKLEPWVSCETDFLKYTLFNDEYKTILQRLDETALPDDVHFLNPPHALLQALDKKEAKRILSANDLNVTLMLDTPHSFDELAQALSGCSRGVFSETTLWFGSRWHYGNPLSAASEEMGGLYYLAESGQSHS